VRHTAVDFQGHENAVRLPDMVAAR
jgi:hypothetical protein